MTIVYNEIEGRLRITLTEEMINEILNETKDAEDGILKLNKWAIPHWDAVKSVSLGAVSISKNTAEYIIGRLSLLLKDKRREIVMMWMNYGWRVDETLSDDCVINFHKVEYKETE